MKIAIIGAGAAGCFAAANMVAKQGDEIVVFEKTSRALQKVKASGGGRCNVTHSCFEVAELVTKYPRGKQLLRKSLYQFTPQDTIDWFESRGVKLKTEADGRIFPITDSSQTIIDCIWHEMMGKDVMVYYNKALQKIEKQGEQFLLHFAEGFTYRADRVLITTGGFPKPEQYNWLKEVGHTIQSPVPSLFTFNIPKHPITALMGVGVEDVVIKIAGTKITEQGPILITHWGLSGPVVLRTSAWAARELNERNYDFKVLVNWLGTTSEADLKEIILYQRKEQGKQFVQHKNPFGLPKRLWEHILMQCSIKDDTRWGDLPAAAQNKLTEHLIRDSYEVKGKTTFKEEFVTCGGITLSEVDPQSMESRIVKGLFFAGEILDADGITGGFNFQHAWNSGMIAARHIVLA